ncbi:MAG: Succinate dehydrogenase [Oscillospiraceae bacterium]|nr:Succinate dehydrogenase [Oscillospiraceae bacterium]
MADFWDIDTDERNFETGSSEFGGSQEVDVVVIGGGGAGLAAAVRAAEAGAKQVVLLEKNKKLGGCTKIAMGVFAVESSAQKRQGIHHTIDECFTRHMYISNWSCDSRLVRRWMRESGKVMDWLEGYGVEFDEVGTCSGPIQTYHMSHHRTGLEIVNRLTDACVTYGVKVLTGTRAKKLLTDRNGEITGVMAQKGEAEINIRTKSVILATGSLAANQELVKRFFPGRGYENAKIMAAMPFSTGDGFLMAEEAGAMAGRVSPNYIGPHNHPRNVLIGCLLRRPHMMIVNKNGERYINEDLYGQGEFGWMSGKALEEQPFHICYPMMDEACFRDMIANKECANEVEGNQSRHSAETGLLMEEVDPCAWLDSVEKYMPREVEDGMMKICGSLEEAAQWIGCDVDTLSETVERYNGFCDDGRDDDFLKNPKYMYPLKTPPFYVFKGLHGIDNFIGGIKVNDRLEVLNSEFKPIPGLYAAGIATSGWLGQGYGHAGTEMGLTTFSGYSAGYAAGEYAVKAGQN